MLPCKKRKFMEPSDAESNPKVPHTEEITTLEREHMHTQTIKLSPERTVQGELKSDEDLARTARQEKAHGLNCQEKPQDSTDPGNTGGTSTATQGGILKTSGGLTEISARIAEEKKLESDCGKCRHECPSHTTETETPAECSSEEKNSKMINHVCASTDSVKASSTSTIKSPNKFVPVKRSLQLGEIPSSSGETKHTVEFPTDEDDMEFSEMVITLEEDEADSGSDKRKKKRKRPLAKRKRECNGENSATVPSDIELDNVLEHALEDRAKLHNLTATNVRNILHEVITNEHVVAMMKAAINETEEEPKMTRSKLKEVVEKGVVIPSWNLSPVKKAREIKLPPQFLDIPLADDDSSDEEYQPDEEEEDETAEESLLESDIESTASSPRVLKRSRSCLTSELPETDEEGAAVPETDKDAATSLRHVSAEVVPMGPPPPPPRSKSSHDTAFMEKLHAVDEELASVSTEPFQPMSESIIACRTRSKITLKDVPIGQLEAELCAPDATPDMYDHNTADDEDWKLWLQGLMNDDMGNEDEGDDEDDPEYNFLEDLDVPDTEDLRNDRAVRITKKEVNELMEELFETFQEDPGVQFQNDDEQEGDDESSGPEASTTFNTPQAIRFEEPLANMLTQQHMTVKNQLKLMRMKRSAMKLQQEMDGTTLQNERQLHPLILDVGQKKRLQQQMQQHVQLLTQMHLLCSINPAFSAEAQSASIFLIELSSFATNSLLLRRPFNPDFQTAFQSCNLKDALQLVLDFHTVVPQDWSSCTEQTRSLTKNGTLKCVNDVVCLPKQLAWMMATRKLFMYPELLPICSMRTQKPNDKPVYTKAEDNLLALGLKHFEGTEMPKSLISKYLVVTKTPQQVSVRIKNLSYNRVPDNIIRYYKKTKRLPVLFRCCEDVDPADAKPPVEREEHRLPFWLKASLTSIQEEMRKLQTVELSDVQGAANSLTTKGTKKQGTELGCDGNKYPLIKPKDLELTLKPLRGRFSVGSWRQKSSFLKPILMKPNFFSQAISSVTAVQKSLSRPAELLVTNSQDGQIVQTSLTALTSSDKPCQPTPIFRVLLPVAPVPSLPKMALPALTPRYRKSYKRRPRTRKKASPNTTFLMKNFLHSAPLVFTVPTSGFDVISAGNGCSIVQAVNAPIGQGTQGIPVTMLVDPKTVMMTENSITMPVHVSEYQQFSSVVDGLFVKNESSGSSRDSNQKTTNLESDNPVFQSSEHRQIFSNMKSPCTTNINIPNSPCMDLPNPPAVDLLTCPVMDCLNSPKMDSLNSPNAKNLTSLTRESLNSPNAGTPNSPKRPNLNSPKTDLPNSPNSDRLNSSNRDIPNSHDKDIQNPSVMASLNVSRDNCHSPSNQDKTNAEMELSSHVQGPVNVKQECPWDGIEVSVVQVKEESPEAIKTEMERDVLKRQSPALHVVLRQDSHGSENDKPFVLTAGQEQCVKSLVQHASKEGAEANTESGTNSEAVDGQVSSSDKKQQDQCPAPTEVGPEQLSTVTSSKDINAGFSRPSGKPDDSTADDQSDTIPAVPDTGKEKDRQEEEEEEDFDDLTQDEEDEEMSSASEESVLSVPELQETMEKLTWLASESHLSQEGESEEENSQEENSEPEEEDEEDAEGEGEGEGAGDNLHKDEEIVGEVVEDTMETAPSSSPTLKSPPKIQTRKVQQAERAKGASKGRNSHRTRSQRGRARMSKDTAKLLLLCDENILLRDPLREQKDMAFAQAYLSRVREALLHVPGKYEAFLRIIYEFETSKNEATAVELYSSLQDLLFDYPQLLKDFAAFLLPDQALECGLFEEQQAFDKSRRFLRQLEICFAENPSHHQKIIKVLQGCAECFPEEIEELKTQMGVLLKGHDHLQEEFSLFFDHLRPPASRMGDFEFINWTEEKEYEFDGFEEVMLPDVEEEEDSTKMPPPPRSKRRKDTGGGRNNEKEMDLTEAVGTKECSCPCHEGVGEQRLKKTKRRACSQCNCKVCDGKAVKSKDLQEVASANLQTSSEKKDAGNCRASAEELQNEKVESKAPQGQAKTAQGSQTVGTSSTVSEELADERPSTANENGEVTNIRTSSPIELHNSDDIQTEKRLSDAEHTQPAICNNVVDVPQKPPEPRPPLPSQKSGLALADSSSSEAKGPGVQGWEKGANSTVIFPAPIVARELHSSPLVSHTSLDLSRSSLCTGPLVQPVSGVMGVRSFDGISYSGEIPGSISYLCGAQSNAGSLHKPSDNSHELSPSLAVPVHPSCLGTVPAPSAIFGTVPVTYATLSGIPVPSGVLSAVLVPSAILGTVPVPSASLSTVSAPPAVLVQGQVPSASLNTAPIPTTALSTVPVFSITSAHPSGTVHSSSVPSGPLPLVTMPVPSATLSTVTVPSAALSTTLVPANTHCTMPVLATGLSSTAVLRAESLSSTTLRTTKGSSATLSTATLGDTASVSAASGTTSTPAALTKPVPCTSLGASSVNSLTLHKQRGLSLGLSSTQVPCVGFGSTSPLSKDASVATVDRSSTQVPHVGLSSNQAPTMGISTSFGPSVELSSTPVSSAAISSTPVPSVDSSRSHVSSVAVSSTQAPSVTASTSHVPLASLSSTQLASVGVETSPEGIPNIQASPLGLSSTQLPSAGLGSSPALPLFLGSTQMPSVDDATQVPSVILSSTQVPSVDLSNTPVSPVILSSTQVPSVDLGSIQVDLCSTQVAPPSSSSIVPIATISNLQVPSPGLGPQVLYATISSSQTAPGGVINLKIPSGTFINFQVPPVSLGGSWQAPSNLCSPQKTPSSPSAMPKSSACHSTTQDLAGSRNCTPDTQISIPKPVPDCLDSSDLDSNTCLEAPLSRADCEMNPWTSSDTSPIRSELVSEVDTSNLNEGMQLHQDHDLKPKESGAELTVCAKNSKVSSTGEKVVLWTREADRVILTTCQEQGAHQETFSAISRQLGYKTPIEISRRFRELMRLFHTSCEVSSEEEEDATSTSNTDQLSDRDLALSEEEQDE
ncbi:GON-4-like protein isoform X2 [Pleurodeles waltl]|uniref:GON-4-like protein isoform X2 n=1 Tax=Pleurodeles waltl TaxID=8319 RepID=UPI003709BDC2